MSWSVPLLALSVCFVCKLSREVLCLKYAFAASLHHSVHIWAQSLRLSSHWCCARAQPSHDICRGMCVGVAGASKASRGCCSKAVILRLSELYRGDSLPWTTTAMPVHSSVFVVGMGCTWHCQGTGVYGKMVPGLGASAPYHCTVATVLLGGCLVGRSAQSPHGSLAAAQHWRKTASDCAGCVVAGRGPIGRGTRQLSCSSCVVLQDWVSG